MRAVKATRIVTSRGLTATALLTNMIDSTADMFFVYGYQFEPDRSPTKAKSTIRWSPITDHTNQLAAASIATASTSAAGRGADEIANCVSTMPHTPTAVRAIARANRTSRRLIGSHP